MCNELFSDASRKMDCPIRMYPKCHIRAHFDVYVDAKKREIILCCSKCDRPLPPIKVKDDKRTGGKNAIAS